MERVNQEPNSIGSPSEFEVKYVRILTQNSDEMIDITKMVNFIEIYESIYTPFMTVNVNITDSLSILSKLPIIGEEYVELDLGGKDGETGIRGQGFYVYKISDRIQISDKAFAYTLHLISASAIIDMNMKISQAMSGQPSTIVEETLGKKSLGIKKTLYAHPTKNSVSYISNYWTPLQNIKYLCDRSISKNSGSPSYVFFETKKSFNFIPMDVMVGQDSGFTYFYYPNTHDGPIDQQQSIIHKLYVDETFNYIDRIMSGAYGNRTLVIDSTKKNYNYRYYDFLESYGKFNRLNPKPFNTENVMRSTNAVFRHRNIASNSISGMPDENTDQWYVPRITELSAMNSQTVSFDAAGRFNIYAGSVIDIVVPVSDIDVSGSGELDTSALMDKVLTGRYLVTGLKHNLSRERHTVSIQASKDSMIDVGKK